MEQNERNLERNKEIDELDRRQLAMAEEVSKEIESPVICQNLRTNRKRYLAVHWYLNDEDYTTCIDFEEDKLRTCDYAQILDQTINQTIMNCYELLRKEKLKNNEENIVYVEER